MEAAEVAVGAGPLRVVAEPQAAVLPHGTADLQELAEHINVRNRASKIVQRESLRLFQGLYFGALAETAPERDAEGIVVQIRDNGLLVHLPHYGFKGVVYLADQHGVAQLPACMLGGEGSELVVGGSLERQGEDSVVVTASSGRRQPFYLFDKVRVHVDVITSEYRTARLQLCLLCLVSQQQPAQGSQSGGGGGASASKKSFQVTEDTSAMVQAVLAENAGPQDDMEDRTPESGPYRQTNANLSLYELLQSMEDLALTADAEGENGCVV